MGVACRVRLQRQAPALAGLADLPARSP